MPVYVSSTTARQPCSSAAALLAFPCASMGITELCSEASQVTDGGENYCSWLAIFQLGQFPMHLPLTIVWLLFSLPHNYTNVSCGVRKGVFVRKTDVFVRKEGMTLHNSAITNSLLSTRSTFYCPSNVNLLSSHPATHYRLQGKRYKCLKCKV